MKKKLLDRSMLRFVLVGMVNTAVGSAIMYTLYNVFHFSFWVSSASNYILSSILSYFLNKNFTFKSEEKSPGTVIKFALNIAVCYIIAHMAAKPLVAYLLRKFSETTRDNVAMAVGLVFFGIINYFGQRFFVFNYASEKNGK